jgi:hypothetical protein
MRDFFLIIKLLEVSAAPLQSGFVEILFLSQKICAQLQTISIFASSTIVPRRISFLCALCERN